MGYSKLTTTFAEKFREYKISDIMNDPDYKQWLSANDCKFRDKHDKFGYIHFYTKGIDVGYQIMREVDDFIYIPISEHIYKGETIKAIIDDINNSLTK